MPVLIEALPTLSDLTLIGAVGGHLRRPWARPRAFDAVLATFEVVAPRDASSAGWHLGDALGTTAAVQHLETLLRISSDRRYGVDRQMVIHALRRFKKASGVPDTLLVLIEDPDVALHAMGSLRSVLGAREALPHLERVQRERAGTTVGDQAAREARKARKAAS